jgi:UDPglucose 6-dehydrogenase
MKTLAGLSSKLTLMTLTLSVVGCGYLGATHAACMSSLGFTVVGVDTDPEKVALLQSGKLPFYEPGLDTLLEQEMKTGRLSFTTDFSAVKDADVHFVCVGTPQVKDGLAADLTYVKSAVSAIAPYLKNGSLVVGKSTVPVGTAQALRAELSKIAPQADLAWNPEFLREGFAVEDTLTPNRLVVGVANDRAEEILKEVYEPVIALGTPWIRADLPTSELVKVAANSFLATKISFINAMAEVCEAAGGDVTVLAKAIGYDPRIGSRFLQAGIGFGGGCLPKDIRAFMARAEELGAKQALEFLREIDAINLRARQRVIDVVRNELSEDLTQYKIAVLGATFKPDSDDVRDSPALDISVQLHAAGAEVVIHDPQGIEPARKRFPNLQYSEVIEDAIKDADLILHLTEWKEYRQIDPAAISSLVKSKIIIDGRNMLDRTMWRNAGWKFHALGRTD